LSGFRRRKNRLNARNDAAIVPYHEIRDRFLARDPDDDADRLDLYVEIGRFVHDRWLAEELDREQGKPFDEHACWDRWDQCTEKHLRDLRTEASKLVEDELKKGRTLAFVGDWLARWEPLRSASSVVSWVWWEALRGFVGALGLLAFGLLIVWLMPNVAKSIRSAVNDNLPVETRPSSP